MKLKSKKNWEIKIPLFYFPFAIHIFTAVPILSEIEMGTGEIWQFTHLTPNFQTSPRPTTQDHVTHLTTSWQLLPPDPSMTDTSRHHSPVEVVLGCRDRAIWSSVLVLS